MGVVYKARDLKLERFVALKFLSAELSLDSAGKERFTREAKAASALDHPNICTIYQVDETPDGQMFIVMGYYEGETLKDRIARGPAPPAEALEIALQIARGLAHAHRQGIIHRDLKPGNVMIAPGGAVKILDFGLAKLAGSVPITGSGAVLGTAGYMSPEQLRGEEADRRSDVWSLGVVLYEMLTGQPPFTGEYPQAVFYQILNEPPTPASRLRPEIPPQLEEAIQKALRKNPPERYQQIEDMLQDLQALQPTPAPATGRPSPGRSISAKKSTLKRMVWALLLLLIAGGIYWGRAILHKPGVSLPPGSAYRLAVLPFKNISPDPEDEYFAEGITEEMISTLSRIEELQVIARTSMMRYKDAPKRISEIGAELKAGSIVQGSVRKAGGQLRVSVQLIDAGSETSLWSQEYDREFEDIFSIQSDIASNVAEALKIRLREGEKREIARTAALNLMPYELYLKGRYHLNKRTPAAILKSLEYFQQGIDADSSFALAYTGLADAYSLLGSTEYGVMSPQIARPRAEEAALKALRLGDAFAEAHLSLANILLFYERNWPEAEAHFQRAIALNPNFAAAYHGRALYFVSKGEAEAAFRELRAAYSLDPVSPLISLDIGWTHYYFRQYDLAAQQLLQTVELDEYFILAHVALAFTYDAQQRHTEALASIEKAQQLAGDYPLLSAVRGYILARAGRKAEASALLQELLPLAEGKDTYLPPLLIALVYLGLEDREGAFRWIEKGYRERSDYLVYFKVDPKLDLLRSDPRFVQLVKEIGFDN